MRVELLELPKVRDHASLRFDNFAEVLVEKKGVVVTAVPEGFLPLIQRLHPNSVTKT